MSNIAGIDYSMSCPSITVWDGKTYHFYFLINKKKYAQQFSNNINGILMTEWNSPEERYDRISDWAMKILTHHKVERVCIEGYAMGAKGQVFNIGENTGLLKHKLYKASIEFVIEAPTVIKKYARNQLPEAEQTYVNDKNNKVFIKMDKPTMIRIFFKETGISLYDVVGINEGAKSLNPIEDIADSYFMCNLAKTY